MNNKIHSLVATFVGLYFSACTASTLEPALNEPASPRAPAAPIATSWTLWLTYDAEDFGSTGTNPADHAEHDHADHDHAGHSQSLPSGKGVTEEPADNSTYTCSMHPEVVHKGPGSCPICGMKLVPKRGDE